jgi:NAD(P) transhydrogenase
MAHYDMLVIGTGPAGQKAAVQAAKLGKKVGIIERKEVVGGVCINTGTIPSKSLREAVLYLSGFRQRNLYGADYRLKETITIEDLAFRCQHVISNEIQIVQNQMARNRVDMLYGTASFLDPHRLRIQHTTGSTEHTANFIVIAVGTEPARPSDVPFDGSSIIDTDGILTLKRVPTSMVIVGGGVIGTEYASILATMGVSVILIDKRPRLLEFMDAEIITVLQQQMKSIGVVLYHDEEVVAIRKESDGHVHVTLKQARAVTAETLMYAIGRVGATRDLNLPSVGITGQPWSLGVKAFSNVLTSMPRETSSAFPPWPRPLCSRAAMLLAMPSVIRIAPTPRCCLTASMRSRKCRWWDARKRISRRLICPMEWESPGTGRLLVDNSSGTTVAC